MSTPHTSKHTSKESWLGSRTGIATVVVVAILGFLIYRGHTAHLLGFLPYLLLLACPLMHLFMHGGHHHRPHTEKLQDKQRGEQP